MSKSERPAGWRRVKRLTILKRFTTQPTGSEQKVNGKNQDGQNRQSEAGYEAE